MTQPAGVLPVLSVPFTSTDSIEFAALRKEVEWLLDAGADGVTIALVSEILRLDSDERMGLADGVLEANSNRGAVVVSVGAESTAQALRLARHAVSAGATAVMAFPPMTSAASEASLLAHFEALVEATDALPMIVQDASGYAGQPVPLSVCVRLLKRYGADKVQFKPEAEPLGPQLSALLGATDGQARVFEGSGGRALLDAYLRGIVGTMPGPDLAWAIVAMWRALQQDALDRAYAIQAELSPILGFLSSLDSYIAVEKELLMEQGVFGDARRRGPGSYTLDQQTRRELMVLLARLRKSVAQADPRLAEAG
jgi:4-hydroxy-tetrahydrodipicolinate synthase